MRPPAALRPCALFTGAAGALYLAVRLTRPHPAWPAWIDAHLTDLLCLPLVLCLARAADARRRGAARRLPPLHGLAVWLLYSGLFEGALPALGRGTGDPADVVAYAAGWLLFEAALNRGPRA